MAEAQEYRQYAAECLESARTATTEDVRQQFLELAKMWMTAAQQLDDGMSIPSSPERHDQIATPAERGGSSRELERDAYDGHRRE